MISIYAIYSYLNIRYDVRTNAYTYTMKEFILGTFTLSNFERGLHNLYKVFVSLSSNGAHILPG